MNDCSRCRKNGKIRLRLVLHEIDEDERWMRSSERHASKLQGLVDEVLDADRRGECKPLDPDQL